MQSYIPINQKNNVQSMNKSHLMTYKALYISITKKIKKHGKSNSRRSNSTPNCYS